MSNADLHLISRGLQQVTCEVPMIRAHESDHFPSTTDPDTPHRMYCEYTTSDTWWLIP